MSDEIIDSGAGAPGSVPQAVKTLSILSIVGSSLWGLLMLIATLMVFAGGDMMSRMLPAAMNDMITIIGVIMLLMVVLNVVTLIAAIKMMNGNKSAFIMYAVANGIWSLLFLLSGIQGDMLGLTTALAGIGFIVAFGGQMKNMK